MKLKLYDGWEKAAEEKIEVPIGINKFKKMRRLTKTQVKGIKSLVKELFVSRKGPNYIEYGGMVARIGKNG